MVAANTGWHYKEHRVLSLFSEGDSLFLYFSGVVLRITEDINHNLFNGNYVENTR